MTKNGQPFLPGLSIGFGPQYSFFILLYSLFYLNILYSSCLHCPFLILFLRHAIKIPVLIVNGYFEEDCAQKIMSGY